MPEIDAVEEIVAEARKTFDLGDRLKGRKLREGAATVYTNEAAGAALGGAEDERNLLGVVTKRKRWGVLGEIDAAIAEDAEADVTALREKAIDLKVELELSALTFHLRGVPEIIVKAARGQAKKAHGKPGPDNIDEYNATLYAHLFAATIFKVVDAEGAEQAGKLSADAAGDLENFLPVHEYLKLVNKLDEVQFKQAVADSVTSEASF